MHCKSFELLGIFITYLLSLKCCCCNWCDTLKWSFKIPDLEFSFKQALYGTRSEVHTYYDPRKSFPSFKWLLIFFLYKWLWTATHLDNIIAYQGKVYMLPDTCKFCQLRQKQGEGYVKTLDRWVPKWPIIFTSLEKR